MIKEKKDKIKEDDLNFNIEKKPTPYRNTLSFSKTLSKKMDMGKIIEKKKREIKLLVKKKLGNSEFFINPRKPSPLRKLEKGLEKFLFSRNSNLLIHFPKIRKKLWYEQQKISHDLNEKIDIGSLIYSQLKNHTNNTVEKYLNRSSIFKIENHGNLINDEYQKIILEKQRKSNIFKSISPEKKKSSSLFASINISNNSINNYHNYSNTMNTTINSSRNNNINSSSQNKINYINHFNSFNKIRHTIHSSSLSKNNKIHSRNYPNLFKLTSYNIMTPKNKNKIKVFSTNSYSNTQENSENNKKNDNYTTSKLYKTTNSFFNPFDNKINKTNKKNHKKMQSCLIEKVSLLNSLTNKCNNQLYKLVDNSKSKERELTKLKDLEEVFSFKVKKHEDDTTKKLVYQAKNDIYFKMDQNKADLIYLSDQVTQMNDDVALVFVDRIAKNYVKKSNLVEEVTSILNYNNDEKKINEKYYQDLRSKIKKNYNKIIKMDASLDKKKEEIILLHENIFNKND